MPNWILLRYHGNSQQLQLQVEQLIFFICVTCWPHDRLLGLALANLTLLPFQFWCNGLAKITWRCNRKDGDGLAQIKSRSVGDCSGCQANRQINGQWWWCFSFSQKSKDGKAVDMEKVRADFKKTWEDNGESWKVRSGEPVPNAGPDQVAVWLVSRKDPAGQDCEDGTFDVLAGCSMCRLYCQKHRRKSKWSRLECRQAAYQDVNQHQQDKIHCLAKTAFLKFLGKIFPRHFSDGGWLSWNPQAATLGWSLGCKYPVLIIIVIIIKTWFQCNNDSTNDSRK